MNTKIKRSAKFWGVVIVSSIAFTSGMPVARNIAAHYGQSRELWIVLWGVVCFGLALGVGWLIGVPPFEEWQTLVSTHDKKRR